ncbi:MAG TPA: molybdopterin biosynthesis protein [Candidatus Acidoferrales bacterium]|nr:molybdopterin biosynthesis protein [Candidatus Acidoferrales bacterium]
MARKRYLKKTALKEAQRMFFAALDPTRLKSELIPVQSALGRITAEPIFAKISSPHYHGAAMDGICVRAEDTFGATEFAPKRLRLYRDGRSAEGTFAYVDTGNALPAWANAVIMIEKVRQCDAGAVEVYEAAAPWQHVRLLGEDVVATELLLPRNRKLVPYDLGALLAAGHVTVAVKAKPRVAIIPTGDELILPGEEPEPGKIIEFNSTVLAAMIEESGGTAATLARVGDDPGKLKEALRQAAASSDLVAIIAGSSAGEHDFTAQIIEEEGELLAHGIDVMPGKPAVLGVVGGKPVIGIPGYPVSAIVIAREILQPALAKMLGAGSAARATTRALVAKKIASHLGLEEFVRVTLGKVEERVIAVPLGRGAGVITTMVRADGFLRIPSLVEGINAGEEVEVELLRFPLEIENTVLCTGSHDPCIGVLEDQLKARFPEMKIAPMNVGSLGGLLSLQRRETHIAGTHLLDPDTGAYNVPDIKRTIPRVPLVLVHLVEREQGFLVPAGNPRGIAGVADLAGKKLMFVNRQPGSGTRVLLDFHLRRAGIDPAAIRGYEREEYTHMAVAAAIVSGLADVGLGVRSAANALGLDFVPLANEQYDLAFARAFFDNEKGQRLLEIIRSDCFRSAVESLGGYNARRSGEVIYRQ